jgi:hypothetical protein
MAAHTNITSPGDRLMGFVAEPDGRGTLGILWSCLAVLFLNTWTVLHVNIPSPYNTAWRKWLHRLKCWAICVVVPDAISATAFSQWRCARKSATEMKTRLPWWTMEHSFYAEMGGYRVQDDTNGQQYTFRIAQLAWLLRKKLITLPEISRDDLCDRSNANGIAKALALAQSSWFIAQSIARIDQRLPLTTLEIEVVPFVAATWLIYLFWWKKPFDIETYTVIHVERLLPEDLRSLAEDTCSPRKAHEWWRPAPKEIHDLSWDFYWFEKTMNMKTLTAISTSHLIPADLSRVVSHTSAEGKVADWYRPAVNESHPSEWEAWDDLMIYAVGIFFNGLQLAAWRFTFPTPIESLLWKISVLTMLGSVTAWVPVAFLFSCLSPTSLAKHTPFYLLVGCYGIARIYVVVEVFAGLRALPAGVFETVKWSKYIPHLF